MKKEKKPVFERIDDEVKNVLDGFNKSEKYAKETMNAIANIKSVFNIPKDNSPKPQGRMLRLQRK